MWSDEKSSPDEGSNVSEAKVNQRKDRVKEFHKCFEGRDKVAKTLRRGKTSIKIARKVYSRPGLRNGFMRT